jgi:hypothetical protein
MMSLLVTRAKAPTRLAVWLLAIVPCVASAAAPTLTVDNSGWSVPASINASATNVTLLQLLTNPAAYAERYIAVRGVLSVDREDKRLYFSKEFYDAFFPEYAIEIELPAGAAAASTKYQGKYVTLQGSFSVRTTQFSHGTLHVTALMEEGQGRRVKSK